MAQARDTGSGQQKMNLVCKNQFVAFTTIQSEEQTGKLSTPQYSKDVYIMIDHAIVKGQETGGRGQRTVFLYSLSHFIPCDKRMSPGELIQLALKNFCLHSWNPRASLSRVAGI